MEKVGYEICEVGIPRIYSWEVQREIFVFHNKNNKLYQVVLNDEETEVVIQVLLGLHDGKVKIMPDEFCSMNKKDIR